MLTLEISCLHLWLLLFLFNLIHKQHDCTLSIVQLFLIAVLVLIKVSILLLDFQFLKWDLCFKLVIQKRVLFLNFGRDELNFLRHGRGFISGQWKAVLFIFDSIETIDLLQSYFKAVYKVSKLLLILIVLRDLFDFLLQNLLVFWFSQS